MDRRRFLGVGAAALAAALDLPRPGAAEPAAGETLYNGIRLPSPSPPKLAEVPRDPVTPPYLVAPPAVIPIDVGRQLLVDDFLVADTTLRRTHHRPQPHPDNPVLRPEKPWERKGRGAMAMVFSDGVWFDPKDRLFKMWYLGGYGQNTCHAVSEDGVRWTRPELDVVAGTNIVQPDRRDSAAVWLDLEEKEPRRRFKLFRSHLEADRFGVSVYFSADGVHWGERVLRTGSTGDRTTAFWNPFRKVWVYSIRHGWGQPRRRRYWETPDLVHGPMWTRIDEPPLWAGSDRLDPQRDDLRVVPELYNLDCVAYESVLLGLFSIWRGDRNIPPGRPKINEVCVGFSRDGWHWHRPDRRAFIGVSEHQGDWNWGNVQSAGGCCLVVGDKLHFYHSGRSGVPGKGDVRDTSGSTGLATLRRDGFASLDAGPEGGTLTTRPVRFSGEHLFVNLEAARGELTAEVLDEQGKAFDGLGRADCIPVRADRTLQAVTWQKADLAAAAGKLVRFRFHLKDGRLYAFWVSGERSGASGGYVAAGGPGFAGPADTGVR
jgi:hypothetical protein